MLFGAVVLDCCEYDQGEDNITAGQGEKVKIKVKSAEISDPAPVHHQRQYRIVTKSNTPLKASLPSIAFLKA